MGLAQKQVEFISIAEYLDGENISSIKHEYLDGTVYAMAGASDRHNRLSINLTSKLDSHLADDSCDVFMADMKVQASETTFYYPDVMVACDGNNADPYFRKQPRLIIEVTSPSTENIDRSEKLLAYKQIKSLKEYVLVSQDSVRIDIYRRMRGERWQLEILTDVKEELHLESIGLKLSVALIYRRVKLPSLPRRLEAI